MMTVTEQYGAQNKKVLHRVSVLHESIVGLIKDGFTLLNASPCMGGKKPVIEIEKCALCNAFNVDKEIKGKGKLKGLTKKVVTLHDVVIFWNEREL